MTRQALRPGRREEILKAAGELFGARGYHATGMRELAHALEIKGSSLYAHIDGKEDLLWEIVDRAASAFTTAADAVPDDLPARQRLELLIRAHLLVIAGQLDYATVFFQDWVHLSDAHREELLERRDAYQRRFRQAISDGAADGTFEVEDVDLATLVVLSALNFSYQWYDPGGRLDPDQLGQAYARVLLNGLEKRSRPQDRAAERKE